MRDKENLDTFKGILFNNQKFASDEPKILIKYSQKGDEKEILNKRYKLTKLTENLSTINMVVALMNYFSSRLSFTPDFPDLTVKNPLELLNKHFEKENFNLNSDQMISIFDMLLDAIDIKHRVIYLNPYSPYDYFRYPLVEIYDESIDSWIVFDFISNCLFLDAKGNPKSLFELRVALAKNKIIIPSPRLLDKNNLEKMYKKPKYLSYLSLIAKYIFCFTFEADLGTLVHVVPINFDFNQYNLRRLEFLEETIENNFAKKEKDEYQNKYKLYKKYLLESKNVFEGYKFMQK